MARVAVDTVETLLPRAGVLHVTGPGRPSPYSPAPLAAAVPGDRILHPAADTLAIDG